MRNRLTVFLNGRRAALATLALLVLPALASATPSVRVRLPEAPPRFFYDETGVLSSDERRVLEDTLMAFDKRGLETALRGERSRDAVPGA